jgi:hypothetical protein
MGIFEELRQLKGLLIFLDGDGNLQFVNGASIILQSADFTYYGLPTVDGSWRSGRSGNNFIHQRLESGNWVTKQTISA